MSTYVSQFKYVRRISLNKNLAKCDTVQMMRIQDKAAHTVLAPVAATMAEWAAGVAMT